MLPLMLMLLLLPHLASPRRPAAGAATAVARRLASPADSDVSPIAGAHTHAQITFGLNCVLGLTSGKAAAAVHLYQAIYPTVAAAGRR